jgi:hypothetical protein
MEDRISGPIIIDDNFFSKLLNCWFYLIINDKKEAEVWLHPHKGIEEQDRDDCTILLTIYGGVPTTPQLVFEGLKKVYAS